MSIKLEGSTDGSVKLAAPADTSPTGTDVTLTLPTSAGSAGQYLRNSSTAGELEFGTLSVTDPAILQVRTAFKSTSSSHTSTNSSFNAVSGLSVSITPASTNNKILVIARVAAGGAASYRMGLHLRRGGSALTAANNSDSSTGSRIQAHSANYTQGGNNLTELGISFLDSPATTSATTYQVGISSEGNSTVYVNRSSSNTDADSVYLGTSFIYAMEIDGDYVS